MDNHIDQLYDTQKNPDEGTMGELISNTKYHIDKCIDQMYDYQKVGDEGMMGAKIPNS